MTGLSADANFLQTNFLCIFVLNLNVCMSSVYVVGSIKKHVIRFRQIFKLQIFVITNFLQLLNISSEWCSPTMIKGRQKLLETCLSVSIFSPETERFSNEVSFQRCEANTNRF